MSKDTKGRVPPSREALEELLNFRSGFKCPLCGSKSYSEHGDWYKCDGCTVSFADSKKFQDAIHMHEILESLGRGLRQMKDEEFHEPVDHRH